MRITIVTLGSLGDVQPYLGLALGLRAAGHSVRMATHREFETLVRGRGMEFAPIEGNPQALLESEVGLEWLETDNNPVRYIGTALRILGPMIDSILDGCWAACRDADVVIDSMPLLAGLQSAERLGIPGFYVMCVPVDPSRAYPHPLVPLPRPLNAIGPLNLLTHAAVAQALWLPTSKVINRWRASLGMRPIGVRGLTAYRLQRRIPTIFGYSDRVMPRPADWPAHVHVAGYWFVNQTGIWQPPADLAAFLAEGPPPVSIGFGSMKVRDPLAAKHLVLEALRRTGQRAVVLGGWAGLGRGALPPTVFAADAVPHDWLFPRVAAVVRHGGAGTTAAGLRAGVPSIITPFFGDQPLWGARVAELGVGPAPIPSAG